MMLMMMMMILPGMEVGDDLNDAIVGSAFFFVVAFW